MIAFLSRTIHALRPDGGLGRLHPPTAEAPSDAVRRRAGRGLARTLCAGLLALAVGGAAWGGAPARAGGVTVGINNGDFETGNLTGWSTTGYVTVGNWKAEIGGSFCHGGTWCAAIGPDLSSLSQEFVAPSGPTGETLTFWYQQFCSFTFLRVTLEDMNTGDKQYPYAPRTGGCTDTGITSYDQVSVSLIGSHTYTLTLQGAPAGEPGWQAEIDDVRIYTTSPLDRYYAPGVGHWVTTTGTVGSPYVRESTLGYVYPQRLGQFIQPIYGCLNGTSDHFISLQSNCEGQQVLGREGYLAPNSVRGTVALYRCYTGWDHFVSPNPNCEGQHPEGLLGYAWAPAS